MEKAAVDNAFRQLAYLVIRIDSGDATSIEKGSIVSNAINALVNLRADGKITVEGEDRRTAVALAYAEGRLSAFDSIVSGVEYERDTLVRKLRGVEEGQVTLRSNPVEDSLLSAPSFRDRRVPVLRRD